MKARRVAANIAVKGAWPALSLRRPWIRFPADDPNRAVDARAPGRARRRDGGYREVEQPPAPPPSTTRTGPVLPDPERCRRVVGGHERSRAGRRRR